MGDVVSSVRVCVMGMGWGGGGYLDDGVLPLLLDEERAAAVSLARVHPAVVEPRAEHVWRDGVAVAVVVRLAVRRRLDGHAHVVHHVPVRQVRQGKG